MAIVLLLVETISSTLLSIGRLALLLIPVIILIEITRYFQVIERITGRVKGTMQLLLTLPQEAVFPLMAGMFFGIVLGSALIIDYAREGYLKKRDLLLIGIFLSISHSIVEDTFIFAVFGANSLVILVTRTILAIIITRIAAALMDYYATRQRL
ncbi:MAG: nucleoside recognition protein [Dethiobacteria bacterium]|nr:nucleoside recognition protein [Dethiobacteria bacterium]